MPAPPPPPGGVILRPIDLNMTRHTTAICRGRPAVPGRRHFLTMKGLTHGLVVTSPCRHTPGGRNYERNVNPMVAGQFLEALRQDNEQS